MFRLDPHASKHIQERWASLTRLDDVRLMQLLEAFQYGTLYLIAGFFAGSFLDTLFPLPDDMKETPDLLLEVAGQLILFIFTVFYIRKLVKIVPFAFMLKSGYKPYQTPEYSGEITIGLVLIATQFGLLKKIDTLSRRFYEYFVGAEKNINL